MNKKSIVGIVSDVKKNYCSGGKSSPSLFLLLLLMVFLTVSPAAFADENEEEGEKDEDREDDDDEGLAFGSGIPDAILYGTIALIVGTVAYTGFKIYKVKRPKMSSR
ncbi:MAG: hypothetical protein OEY17_05945 [Nitrosopumilus sp.]|nr:hypothetical protein [Nitrosopumilus sp.]MDH5658865.1 hypothetical protein [Nitrosopumilus sp.]